MLYMPHGQCWYWNPLLISLHAPADLITFGAYLLIPFTVLYVYRAGQLQGLRAAYPQLWRLGASFVLFCGLSHLGAFLEIWVGGWMYWITGANKVVMALVSAWFAMSFWRNRRELAFIGRVLDQVNEEMRRSEAAG